jgi:hypothetical protein
MEHWSVGVLECWSVGVLECWSVGVLECWSVGSISPPLHDSNSPRLYLFEITLPGEAE